MAARERHRRSDPPSADALRCLSVAQLHERLVEEIDRAARHGTQLSCLLVVIEDLRERAGELPEDTLAYVAGALRRELRRFDRVGRCSAHELLILLPGADDPRGEMVARRVLDRVRAIKIESQGARHPLRVTVGLTAWRRDEGPDELLARARTAAAPANGGDAPGAVALTGAPTHWRESPGDHADPDSPAPPLGGTGRS